MKVLISYVESEGQFELTWRSSKVSQVYLHTINGKPSYINVPNDVTEREVHRYTTDEERQKILALIEEHKA